MTRPFVADRPVGMAFRHERGEPEQLPDTVPPEVRHVVMRALREDPDHRWPSAHAMAQAATDAARGLPHAPFRATAAVGGGPSPRIAGSPTRPAPTAKLTPLDVAPRRTALWVALIAIAAGLGMVVAATVMALSATITPGVSPPPPASVTPVEGGQSSPQQTDGDHDGGRGNGSGRGSGHD